MCSCLRSKAAVQLELPGIVDEVVTLAEIKADDGSITTAPSSPTPSIPTAFRPKTAAVASTCWNRRHLGAAGRQSALPPPPAPAQPHPPDLRVMTRTMLE